MITTRPRTTLRLVTILSLAALAACARQGASAEGSTGHEVWFREAALERGLDFVHESGHRRRYYMPEINCGGGALFDMDGDGDLDAYCVQSGGIEQPQAERPPNRLYRNDGDGRFVDVTEGSGAGDRGYGMGTAVGDYDGDGDLDLYVTNVRADRLLRNEGGARFTDVTAAAGIRSDGWATSAAFHDFDLDGDLDLYVVRYVDWTPQREIDCMSLQGPGEYCSPVNYGAPRHDLLFRNDGDGTFTDVSEGAGLPGAAATGLGLVCGDFDGDGLPDVFVANDQMENHLWLNQGGLRFEESARETGCAVDQMGAAKAGMGTHAVDQDDDGDLDLLVVNLVGESDSFFRNEGRYFKDRTAARGLGCATQQFTRFGVGLLDFDLDGFVDLFLADGRVSRRGRRFSDDPYAEPNQVLRGGADGRFRPVSPGGGTEPPVVGTSRGAAFGDVDQDGDVDVLVFNRDLRAHLLINEAPRHGAWIGFRVVGRSGSDAIGAGVQVSAGRRTLTREVRAAYSYLTSNDLRVHVGLGPVECIDRVVVTWPDGEREEFAGCEPGAYHVLARGSGRPVRDE